MQLLKVGDKIYQINQGRIVKIIKVERVTKTQAICDDDKKFKLQYFATDSINIIGGSSKWCMTHYELETPSLKEKLYRQNSIAEILKTDYTKMPTADLVNIISVIEVFKREL
jgi:hypothetical protein